MSSAPANNSFLARGGAWVVIQFVLMAAVIAFGVLFHGAGTGLGFISMGVGLFLVGGGFGISGIMVLGRNRTPFPKPREPSELVQRGIYAQVRHPLYSSVMLISLGWSLIWESWAASAVALALIPFFHAKARREEDWLRDKFPGYADYARRVPRFLPRLGKAANLVCNF